MSYLTGITASGTSLHIKRAGSRVSVCGLVIHVTGDLAGKRTARHYERNMLSCKKCVAGLKSRGRECGRD